MRFALAFVLLAAVLLLKVEAQTPDDVSPSISEVLLSLPAAVTNWDVATAAVPGAPWVNGTAPCGGNGTTGGGGTAWKGLTCDTTPAPTRLELPGLGLQGTLPGELATLPYLQVLNLSRNAFLSSLPTQWTEPSAFRGLTDVDLRSNQLTGTLPAQLVLMASHGIFLGDNQLKGWLPGQWSSAFLQELDLGNNLLSGLLPTSWGDKTALPSLFALNLAGNQLRGPVPDPQWTSVGFAAPCNVYARPLNPFLCGPLLELDPQLYDHSVMLNPTLNYTVKKPQNGRLSNTTTLVVWETGLFGAEVTVSITNTLGSCSLPCSEAGMKPDSAAVTTNFYDMTWQLNVSASALLNLNPRGSTARPGDVLALPCYPPGQEALAPSYFGGSTAYLRYSGGNQRAGPEGLGGAMAASGTNDHPPNLNDFDNPYTGSLAPNSGNTSQPPTLVQPVWLFVDMEAEFQVSTVVLTAGGAMRNASLFIGSNNASVQSNALVAWGLDFAPREQAAVAVGGAKGRYVIVFTGLEGEGEMSVSDFQVYADETNAATNKGVDVSGLGASPAGFQRRLSADSAPYQALVDGLSASCTSVRADNQSNTAWVAIDLGYAATVGAVSVLSGPSVAAGTMARAYVLASLDEGFLGNQACGNAGMVLSGGGWSATPCNATGRVVVVTIPAVGSIDLCEVQVALTQAPSAAGNINGSGSTPPTGDDGGGDDGSSSSSSSLSTGAIVGIAVGGVAVVVLAALLVWWLLRRRAARASHGSKQHMADWDSEKGAASDQPVSDQATGGRTPGAAPDSEHGSAAAAAAAGAAAGGAAAAALLPKGGSGGIARSASQSVDSDPALASNSSSTRVPYGTPEPRGSLDASVRATSLDVARGSSGTLTDAAITDLSKLPPGFNDVASEEFELQRTIGSGSFGEVWLARYCETNVAVKMLTNKNTPNATSTIQQQTALRNLHQEAGLMSRLRHPNVCQYLGACSDPPCLLMEYCAKRSVDSLLVAALSDPKVAKQLRWGRLLNMALDAAKGMLYLHTRTPPIAHRDLKSANLLVDSQWHVKVADFNLSRALESNLSASTLFITNPRWLSPEVLSGHPGQLAADVWAFGTVLWELATWRLPFEHMNPFQIITHVQTSAEGSGLVVPAPGELPSGPCSVYREYVGLMRDCWHRIPAKRPHFDQIVKRLRAMLTAELKSQQAAAGDRGSKGGRKPDIGSSGLAPQGSGALDAALAAAVVQGDQATEAAAAPGGMPPTGVPAAAAHSGGSYGGIPRVPSRGLDDTPFAALSRTQLLASPPDGPSPRDS